MVAQHILESVFALPVAEQIELVDRVRERVRAASWPSLSDAQRRELDAQLDDFDSDLDEGMAWAAVDADIRAALGER